MSIGAYVGMGRSIIGHAGGTPSMPTEHHRWCGIQKIPQKHQNHRSQKPNNNTNKKQTLVPTGTFIILLTFLL